MPAYLLAKIIRFSVNKLATRFIAGENIHKVHKTINQLSRTGRSATLDQLGELVVTPKEANSYLNKVMEIIEGMRNLYPRGSRNAAGIYMAHVSIKVSALTHDFKPYAFDYTFSLIAPKLEKILIKAKEEQVFINIDAEHYSYRDCVFKIYAKVLLECESLHDYDQTGIVLQTYLRDSMAHFLDIARLAQKRNLIMPIRLVKGAYWDGETIEARAHSHTPYQFLNKEETDIHFRQMIAEVLKTHQHLQLAIAGHNLFDHCYAEILRKNHYPDAPLIEHQCLHMTYEALSYGLAKLGFPTRNYMPVGNLLVGMAYLVRRILENSSQLGILTQMRSHKSEYRYQDPYELLKQKHLKGEVVFDESLLIGDDHFKNIYPIKLYKQQSLDFFNTFLEKHTKINLDSFSDDTQEMIESKINTAAQAHENSLWKTDICFRLSCLQKLAMLLLKKREELSVLIMQEAFKTIGEAIADVDEAIDFINFYIREMWYQWQSDKLTSRGVIAVIAPWNFPLAIPCGMSVGALVSGNAVILKPATQTPHIATALLKLAAQAGIPQEIFQIVYGGAQAGAALTEHPVINGVVFTGSKNVGTQIYKNMKSKLSRIHELSCSPPKMVVAEMGGKNAVIVTNNSDLDEAVSGLLYSCFAHAGQKCSACSRIIIDTRLKQLFIKRFVAAVKGLKVGDQFNLSTSINSLISKEQKANVLRLIKNALAEAYDYGGVVHLNHSETYSDDCTLGPTILELPKQRAFNRESSTHIEFFAPVVHIIAYDTIDEAIQIFNATEYALTGGIYSQSQDEIDYMRPKLLAGNIYINRPNTGARVAIEPFGGFKLSGTGPKAGGTSYLRAFHLQKTIKKENREHKISGGSEYLPQIPKNSSVPLLLRQKLLEPIIDSFLNSPETYYPFLDESDKLSFKEFLLFIKDNLVKIYTAEHPNRYIPGQLSFDKINIKLGAGLMLCSFSSPSLSLLKGLIASYAIGNGVCLFTTNNKCYTSLLPMIGALRTLNKDNLDIYHIKLDRFYEFLKKESFKSLYLDTSDELMQKVVTEFRNYLLKKDYLLKVFTEHDFHRNEDYTELFSVRRTMAINIMRHGAPLELSPV
jgi:RHH-type proline utilization regulon transcriptional repressor/proline dehydrogenase/delta 1-pyrroline-5-carboxylate dehydrogenase